MDKFFIAIGLAVLCLTSPLQAGEVPVSVNAWARATPPGGSSGAIYGEFRNHSAEVQMVTAIRFDLAHHAMVHETSHSDGMARMQAGTLRLPAAGSTILAPGGLHIMLMGLSEGLKTGCEYSFQLTWADGSVSRHAFLTGEYGQMAAPDTAIRKDCP